MVRFLINALRYYIDEFKVDGYRLDAITSMIFRHHGISRDFRNQEDYFSEETDIESLVFLKLAIHCTKLLHPQTIFIAEDSSGFPLLGIPQSGGGIGFDYMHAMMSPDIVVSVALHYQQHGGISIAEDIVKTLLLRKPNEKYIVYTECHDQCFHGGQTLIQKLIGSKSTLC